MRYILNLLAILVMWMIYVDGMWGNQGYYAGHWCAMDFRVRNSSRGGNRSKYDTANARKKNHTRFDTPTIEVLLIVITERSIRVWLIYYHTLLIASHLLKMLIELTMRNRFSRRIIYRIISWIRESLILHINVIVLPNRYKSRFIICIFVTTYYE